MWEKLRVFNNEVWLEVQGKFIQDHQDIDSVTREGLSSDQETSTKYLKEWKKRCSKTYVLALPDQDKSFFISTMMHLIKVWDVSLCKKKK